LREIRDLNIPFSEYAGFTDAIASREETKQREAREVFRKISPKLTLPERIAIAIAWRRFVDGGIVEWAVLNETVTRALGGDLNPGESLIPF
jgi:hypothetical protein